MFANFCANAHRITLGWYDAPSVGGSTTKALLQNLDLTAVAPTGGTVLYGNGGTAPDSTNTNEQIFVQTPPIGAWKVTFLHFV